MESRATWVLVSLASFAACGRVGFAIDGDAASDGKGGSTEEILDGPLPDVTIATGCVTWSPTDSDDNAEIAIKDDSTSRLDEYHIDTSGSNVHYDNYEGELFDKGSGWTTLIQRDQPKLPQRRHRDVGARSQQRKHLVRPQRHLARERRPGRGREPDVPRGRCTVVPVGLRRGRLAVPDPREQSRSEAFDTAGFESFAAAVGKSDSECVSDDDDD